MKNLYFSILFLILILSSKDLFAQQKKGLYKNYEIVSAPYPVPDNDQRNFPNVNFRFGWSGKALYSIGIQFVNHGYSTIKLKFAIKDVTSNKMIVLDTVHNSCFGSVTLNENSESAIWSGPIVNIKDSFSLHVWNSNGDEFDKEPISIKDQQ